MMHEKIKDNRSGAAYICAGIVWKMGIKILYFVKDTDRPGPNKMQFTHEFFLKLLSLNELEKI